MSRFDDQLLFGQAGEVRVRDTLCEGGGLVSKFGHTNSNDFQLVIHNKAHRVEVKNEDRYAYTGNLCIELQQGRVTRKRSGLAISEASIVVHTLGDNAALYRAAKMREHLWNEMRAGRLGMELFRGSDNGNRGVIVAIGDFQFQPWFDYRLMSELAESPLWLS